MPIMGDAESQGPRRAAPSISLAPIEGPEKARLRWRAIVHAGQKLDTSRGHQPLAWHLADCTRPDQPESHCEIGRLLMATDGNPDGHCQLDGVCPRCPKPSAEPAAAAPGPG